MQNLPLSKEQYLLLLKVVNAAAMMQAAIDDADEVEEADQNKIYEELESHLFTHAEAFGITAPEDSEDGEGWFEEVVEASAELVNDYAEVEMFDNLAWDLASIEFEKRKGNDTFTDIEEYTKRGEIYDAIMNEFDENDLEHVKIEGIIE